MSDYLLIESRSPAESANAFCHELARQLAAGGHRVTMFLVQNGVLPARQGAKGKEIEETSKAGVTVLADDFSLRERSIGIDQLVSGVTPSPLEAVIDCMSQGYKTVWH